MRYIRGDRSTQGGPIDNSANVLRKAGGPSSLSSLYIRFVLFCLREATSLNQNAPHEKLRMHTTGLPTLHNYFFADFLTLRLPLQTSDAISLVEPECPSIMARGSFAMSGALRLEVVFVIKAWSNA